MMDKLKACPFCGGKAKIKDWTVGYENGTSIICAECGAAIHESVETGNRWHERAATAWNHRAQPESKPLTNFEHITASPKSLAEFLQLVYNGIIEFDKLYCDECGNCLEDGGCKKDADELDCIMRYLNKPEQEEK